MFWFLLPANVLNCFPWVAKWSNHFGSFSKCPQWWGLSQAFTGSILSVPHGCQILIPQLFHKPNVERPRFCSNIYKGCKQLSNHTMSGSVLYTMDFFNAIFTIMYQENRIINLCVFEWLKFLNFWGKWSIIYISVICISNIFKHSIQIFCNF